MVQIEDVCLATTHRLGHEVYFLTRGEVAYLADLDRGRFYGLDAVGAEMVALLLGRGESAAVEHIAREYDVDEGRVRSDLDALLGNLGRRGLLVPVGGEEPVTTMIFQNRCWVFGPGIEFTGKGGEEPLSGEERAGRFLLRRRQEIS